MPPGWQPSRRDRTDLGSSFSRTLTGAVFVVAGLLHFLVPSAYQKIMPPYLPLHHELIYLSGATEVAGGMGLLSNHARRVAGLGLILFALGRHAGERADAARRPRRRQIIVVGGSPVAAPPAAARARRMGLEGLSSPRLKDPSVNVGRRAA